MKFTKQQFLHSPQCLMKQHGTVSGTNTNERGKEEEQDVLRKVESDEAFNNPKPKSVDAL
jgi:hypothetical protein